MGEVLIQFQQALLSVLLVTLAVCVLTWLSFWARRFFSTVFRFPWRYFRRQPVIGQIVCGVLVLGCMVFASTKRNTSTNSPPTGLLSVRRPTIESTMPHEVSSDEIARGYYLAAESGNLPLAALPDGCVTNDLLRLRGGFDWVFDIAPTNWYFPYRDGYLTNVTVFTRGEVRPSIQQTFFPVPLTNGVSVLPEGRWPLLTNGPSIFRHGVTTNGTLLLDWRNALVGRDLACPTNLQFALAQDGSFAVRTTGHAEVYAPVFPFDWDNDGLANDVDPSPTCADPDAHGTNATWYNTVCSNVFAAVDGPNGVILSPRHAGVNTNAYYFVDVVTEKGPAAISFTADQPGRLGSPVIVAQAGETNIVPLLIGVTYAVTSSVPIEVSVHADDGALIVTNDSQHLTISWPLTFDFAEAIAGSNRTYTVSVEPERMSHVGAFFWNTRSSGGDSSCWQGSSNCVIFTCSPPHACAGDCNAQGVFAYEEAVFSVKGGMCRCGFTDPIAPVAATNTVTSEASLTISFSEEAIIFEDTYLDSFKTWKPRRSTRCYLSIFAYGGPDGANLQLTTQNLQKLAPIGCGPMMVPAEVTLAPHESYSAVFLCEGISASSTCDDISVSGELAEIQSRSQSLISSASLTVVRVKFKNHVVTPNNDSNYRHTYGVCEYVEYEQLPLAPQIFWNPIGGGSTTISCGTSVYCCPTNACQNPLRCDLHMVNYRPLIKVIEPMGIQAVSPELKTYGLSVGHSGGVGLVQQFQILPLYVSFSRLAVEEIPCDRGEAIGYFRYAFATNLWSHTRSAGAGIWKNVDIHNHWGVRDHEKDEAAITEELFPMTTDGVVTNDFSVGWIDGTLDWEIPFGWNVLGTSGDAVPLGDIPVYVEQQCMIQTDGTCGVRKFFNQVKRRIDGKKFMNGIEVK